MPKLGNHLPKYRLHKVSGQAIVTLSGKDHYLGPHGTKASKDQYDRLIAEWLANNRCLPSGEETTVSMEELLAAFWVHAEQYYVGLDGQPTKELDSYRQAMKPLLALYRGTDVDDFGPLKLKTIRQGFIDKGRARKGINQQIGRIKRIFKWGVENELVSPSVFQALQAVVGLKQGRSEAKETPPVKPVVDEHVEAVQHHVSKQVWAMIQLQLLTGMRSGEVTAMRGCDITIKEDMWEYRPPFHKTAYRGKQRSIPLGPRAQEIIKPFLKPNTEEYLFSPKDAQAERNSQRRQQRKSPMTPSQAGRKAKRSPKRSPGDRYNSGSYGRAITYATKKAGIPHWTPHQLRHAAATKIRKEYGLEAAQVILGHSHADVTQIYAEANHVKAKEIMAAVG